MSERGLFLGMGIGSVAGLGASALLAGTLLSSASKEAEKAEITASDMIAINALPIESAVASLGSQLADTGPEKEANEGDLEGALGVSPALSVSKTALSASQGMNPLSYEGELSQEIRELDSMLDQIEERLSAMIEAANAAVPNFATALAEADRLGIIAEIEATQPNMRKQNVWRIAAALVREARRFDLDPLLLTAVARVESAYNPLATSHVGARGVLQVMVITGGELLNKRGERLSHATELYDIETNIGLGAEYLSRMLESFGGNLDRALVAYNRGPAGARQALKGENAVAILAGYPHLVRTHHQRLNSGSLQRLASLGVALETLGSGEDGLLQ